MMTYTADLLGERDEVGLALRHDGLHEARRGRCVVVEIVVERAGGPAQR